MIPKKIATKNILSSDKPERVTGTLIEITSLNAILLEPNGNKLPVVLLDSSFALNNTVLCINGVVQRKISKQKQIQTVVV